ncbi:hypothetical protein D3C81_1867730 [compost metagenome]
MRQHRAARGRRLQAAPGAGEQRHHEDVLDLAQRLGDGGLRQVQLGRHARHRALALQCQQQRQVPEAQAGDEVVDQLVGGGDGHGEFLQTRRTVV